MFRDRIADPRIGAVVGEGKLFDRERLADAPPKLVGHDIELSIQPLGGHGISHGSFEAAIAVFPFVPDCFDHHRHGRRTYPLVRRANGGPGRIELREDALAEGVAGARKRERDVSVEAFERSRAGPGTCDAEIELRPKLTLLGVCALQARAQGGVFRSCARPALDAARCLQPRDRSDQIEAGEPERRRKGLAVVVVRALLGDGGVSRRTADDDAPEGARWPA